jgi:outer membrane protein insertion porin family
MSGTLARTFSTAALVACLAVTAAAQEPRITIEDMVFTGDLGLPLDELNSQVRSHYGGLPPANRVSDVPETVRRILIGEGFRRATATGSTVRVGTPERTQLVVKVDAGPRTMIASVKVTGTSPMNADRILSRTGAYANTPFRERHISTELARIRADLREDTFYKAIAVPRPEFPDDDERRVDLTLFVDAGPRVRIRYLPDKSHLPSGNVEDYIPIAQEHSVEQDLLDDAVREIVGGLKRDGYWRATATHRQESGGPGEMVVIFDIARGRRYRIERVDVPTGMHVPAPTFEAEPGLKPGDWFSEDRALAAMLRIRAREYWGNGYHQATFLPEFREADEPGRGGAVGRIIVYPNFTEGVRATIREITFDLGPKPRISPAALRVQMQAVAGAPYSAVIRFADYTRLLEFYTENGHASASLNIETTFNEAQTEVSLAVTAREGPRVTVGTINVVGNRTIRPDVLLRDIDLQSGQPYSEARRLASQRQIHERNSLRSVLITPEPRINPEVQDITISVVEAPNTTIGPGGGVEMAKRVRTTETGEEDRVEFAPRGFLEVTRRNLGGMNRSLSFFGRASLQAKNAPGDPTLDGACCGFSEYRVSTTYQERYAFRSRTDILAGASSEQGVRSTFSFVKQVFNADLVRRLRPGVGVSARYALEFNELFDERFSAEEQRDIDRLFPEVRLSIVSGGFAFDRRDDPAAPTRGSLITGTADFALRPLGSEIGYIKTFMQGIYFHPLTENRRLVLGLRMELGLAHGFEREVEVLDEDGNPVLGPDGQPVVETVADLPASQRFYAGGSTTVRGFAVDRLGVREVLNDDGLSNGGNGLVIMNAELRIGLGNLFGRPLVGVAFADGGNVFQFASDLDFGRLRGAVGLGGRWDSPVGPLRLDVGRKTSLLVFNNGPESRWEWHFSLGHAF